MQHSPAITPRCHGGYCCGITHIYHFPYALNDPLPPRSATPEEMGEYPSNRPAETAYERLAGVIKEIKAARHRGIIEVTLIGAQMSTWRQALEGLGFKEVNQAANSNSGNIVHVLHLNTNQ